MPIAHGRSCGIAVKNIILIWQVEGWVSTLVQPFRLGFMAQSNDSIYDPQEPPTHATHQADLSYLHV